MFHTCVAEQASLVVQWLQTATTNLPAAWLLYQETTGLYKKSENKLCNCTGKLVVHYVNAFNALCLCVVSSNHAMI